LFLPMGNDDSGREDNGSENSGSDDNGSEDGGSECDAPWWPWLQGPFRVSNWIKSELGARRDKFFWVATRVLGAGPYRGGR
jgi:hypothetical protein